MLMAHFNIWKNDTFVKFLFHFYSKKGENMVAGFCSTQDARIPEYNLNFNQG